VSSGSSDQASDDPSAPLRLPRLPFAAPAARRAGPARPGRTSSVDGGIDEFPLCRDSRRSSSATRARSASIVSAWAATSATSSSRDSSSAPGTHRDHHILGWDARTCTHRLAQHPKGVYTRQDLQDT
jgi:hypothetical protein